MAAPPSRASMLAVFTSAATPPDRAAVGVEWEKEAVHADGRRVSYSEDGGIRDLLTSLVDRHGWEPKREGPHVVALSRSGSHVTLEPGAQVEIATPPRRSIAELETDLRTHLAELQDGLRGSDARLLTTAFTPIQAISDIPLVPKGRYEVMHRYLGRTGTLAHSMMKGTTSAQFAYDFESERDCGAKLHATVALSPLMTAMTANSPLAEGAPTGDLSHRARAWLSTDPARTRLPRDVVAGFSFEKYLDWALGVPMMFYRRDGQWFPARGRTFAQWIRAGFDGHYPDLGDFDLHLTSLFPDVRVKGFLELRGADNGGLLDILGLATMWKGLLYDPGALDEALSIAAAIEAGGERDALLEVAITRGLGGRWAGRRLRTWVALLLEVAERGLSRQGLRGPGEVAYLAPLRERAERGRSPAQDTLDAWSARDGVEGFLDAVAYPPVESIPRITPGA